uniref:Uncharacterized protein n=1 Tax=Arundo donax TaxID=35708 RepID=A0A0A9GWC9_ARUDO
MPREINAGEDLLLQCESFQAPATLPTPLSGEPPSAPVSSAALHGLRERRKAAPFLGCNEAPMEGRQWSWPDKGMEQRKRPKRIWGHE